MKEQGFFGPAQAQQSLQNAHVYSRQILLLVLKRNDCLIMLPTGIMTTIDSTPSTHICAYVFFCLQESLLVLRSYFLLYLELGYAIS